jgi:cobalt-zinc-cadmium efflux system protein
MEGTPRGIDPREVEEALQKIPGVQQVHHLHIWALTAGKNSMSGHVVIEDQALSAAESIRQSIQEQLQSRYNVDHATIQFEHQQCGVVCTLSNGIEE